MGRDVISESDHKPLEAITKKPLHVAPLRLQRMLVQLQRFPGTTVVYKRGESLHLADALSRAHLEEYLTNAEQLDINLVEHVISDQQLAKFVEATKEDDILFEDWGFHRVTSSPGNPQSNGQSERTVQTVKSMLEKADDPYKALFLYRNTPLEDVNLSPSASEDPNSNDQRNVKTPTV